MARGRYVSELGLNSTWREEDKQECLGAARQAYRQLKRKHGGRNVPVDKIPGFIESVQSLLNDGFGLTDVGVMFGVSRERVRQWANQFDLQRRFGPGTRYRIWDDDKDRFVPVPNELMYHIAECYHDRRLETEVQERQQAARSEHVEALKSLAKRFGRTPTLNELEEELDTFWPNIARYWGYEADSPKDAASYTAAYRRLCDAARIPPREAGGGGHVS